MASPELGDRDAFGLKVGPAGAVVQVFQMRRGRVVERIELVTDAGSADARVETGGTAEVSAASESSRPAGEPACVPASVSAGLNECDVLQAAIQQFYAERTAAPEVHIPMALADADRDAHRGLAVG